jgi:hypothetical protein
MVVLHCLPRRRCAFDPARVPSAITVRQLNRHRDIDLTISSAWYQYPNHHIKCQKGIANLVTMATSDFFTDVILILLPMQALWRTTLSVPIKIQLSIIFSLGVFVIAMALGRVIDTFRNSFSQSTRSTVSRPAPKPGNDRIY